MKFCTNCGEYMQDDMKFCSNCGHSLENAPVSLNAKGETTPVNANYNAQPQNGVGSTQSQNGVGGAQFQSGGSGAQPQNRAVNTGYQNAGVNNGNNMQYQQVNAMRPNKTIEAKKPSKRTGVMIACLVCYFISAIFMSIYIAHYVQLMGSKKMWTVGGVLYYTISYGWLTIIPCLALSIASLATSVKGTKSTSKAVRITCIIICVLSIMNIVGYMLSAIMPVFKTGLKFL